MVGFTLVGIDLWQDQRLTFDIMTVLTKPYRGKKIARGIFDFCLPKVKVPGVKNFVLEVLQENEPAIKAYSKSGFEIVRAFNCCQAKVEDIKFSGVPGTDVSIRKVDNMQLKKEIEFMDWQPPRGNSITSLLRMPDELIVLGVNADKHLVGLPAYYSLIRWINLLAVDKSFRRKKISTKLLQTLIKNPDSSINEISAINVDSGDDAMNSFLLEVGFKQVSGQYEMRLIL